MFSALLLAASGAGANAQAAPAPSAAPSASSAVQTRLANGMRVVLLPDRLAPVATTVMTYDVGSADDTAPGIAHAAEHMLFRGTPSLSGQQLANLTARMGAEYNAMTLEESTLYWYKLPSAYVGLAVKIEADRMTHASVTDADWSTERGAIEQEVRSHQSVPTYAIGQKLREAFFRDTPFAHAGVGTLPAFDAMNAADIRAFYQRWYKPSNATFIVAGDIDPAAVLAEIHAAFDGLPADPKPDRPRIALPPLASSAITANVDFPIGMAALTYRMPGSGDPDYAASQVLAQVLSSSRNAFAQLSQQGHVLAVLSLSNAFRETGACYILAIPAKGDTAQHALALVSSALDAYRKDGVPADLVDAAKAKLLAAHASGAASVSGLAVSWADAAQAGAASPDDVFLAIEHVDVDAVNAVLRRYLTPEHQITMTLMPAPTAAAAKKSASTPSEHVGLSAEVDESLPAWAQVALKAPLRAPADMRANTVNGRLPNGMRYTIRRQTIAPTVVVKGVIRTSPQLYVPKGKDGLADIADRLVGWGTQRYDLTELERQFDAIAATHTLSHDFLLVVAPKDFERGIDLLADGMMHPAFPSGAFTVAKTAEAQGVDAQKQLPKAQAAHAQRLALYPPGDPRRREPTAATVASITLDDVKRYYQSAYRPDETTIAVVGDVSPERVAAALRTSFGSWTASGPRPTFAYPKLPATRTGSAVTVTSKATEESEVVLKQTFTMSRSDRDYVPLQLANTILSGEGVGSMLMQELRTRHGFVYSVDSDVSVDQSGGTFSVSFASDPRNVEKANKAVIGVLRRLQTQPLPLVELQKAKALLLAARILPLDSYSGLADDLLAGVKDGYTGGEDWFWSALLKTTPQDLQHAMRRIDTSRFVRVTVEPDAGR